jgi:hypothetical protein
VHFLEARIIHNTLLKKSGYDRIVAITGRPNVEIEGAMAEVGNCQ